MGIAKNPRPVTYITGVMFSAGYDPQKLLEELGLRLGPLLDRYGPIPFTFTEYYNGEMGPDIMKEYWAFSGSCTRDDLPSIKNWTNSIEARFLQDGKRSVNIDPGYITNDKLVLASTKDFFHRIYLADGIFGEVTLHFRKGIWRYFSWSYADFKDEGVQEFLTKVRAHLVGSIRRSSLNVKVSISPSPGGEGAGG